MLEVAPVLGGDLEHVGVQLARRIQARSGVDRNRPRAVLPGLIAAPLPREGATDRSLPGREVGWVIGQLNGSLIDVERILVGVPFLEPMAGREMCCKRHAPHRRKLGRLIPDPVSVFRIHGLPPVMCQRLDVGRVHPLGGIPSMKRHPLRHRQAAVGDLSDQGMVKAIPRIDRCDESEVTDLAQEAGNLMWLALIEEGCVPNVERLTDHADALQQLALDGRQLVKPGRDGRLDGDRHLVAHCPRSRQLDDEEWISSGPDGIGPAFSSRARQRPGSVRVKGLKLNLKPILARPEMCAASELGPRSREHQDRRIEVGGQPVDDAKEDRIGPMHVIDPDRERPLQGDSRKVSPPRARDQVTLLHSPERRHPFIYRDSRAVAYGRRDLSALCVPEQINEPLSHVVRRGLRHVGVHELPQRRVDPRLCAGPAACLEQPHPARSPDRLAREPALPLTWRADNQCEGGRTVGGKAERVLKDAQLSLAADELDLLDGIRGAEPDEAPRLDLAEALETKRAERLELGNTAGGFVAGWPHDDLTGLAMLLEARCNVHAFADRRNRIDVGGEDTTAIER